MQHIESDQNILTKSIHSTDEVTYSHNEVQLQHALGPKRWLLCSYSGGQGDRSCLDLDDIS